MDLTTENSMALLDDFNTAVSKSKELTKRPSNEELLDLYALFKQATDGDVSGDRPGGFDFKAIAKFDAWATKKNLSKDQAMTDYVSLMNRLQAAYS
ncbi:MAG: acyl-CoA-binding protein [Cyclobacteriaceae bacterium]|nr:acyl-CoA-binding protein [Cyclobacteriaceae bacterium]